MKKYYNIIFIVIGVLLCISLFNNREGFNMQTKTNSGYTNDAPTYSSLTADIGTQAMQIPSNDTPAMANFGVNVWKSAFHKSQNLFDKRYKPPQITNMPNYPSRYSLTGEFMDDGPYASNS